MPTGYGIWVMFRENQSYETQISLHFETPIFGAFGAFSNGQNATMGVDTTARNLSFQGILPQRAITVGVSTQDVKGTITVNPPVSSDILFVLVSYFGFILYTLPAGQSSGSFDFNIFRPGAKNVQSTEQKSLADMMKEAANVDIAKLQQ